MRPLLVLLLLTLGACFQNGPSYRPVRGPNGRPGYSIRCGPVADCYEAAADLCPSGYAQFGGQDRSSEFAQQDAYGNTWTRHREAAEVLVECK